MRISKQYRPIGFILATIAYTIIVTPLTATKTRPGGPIFSIAGELAPIVLGMIGIALGVIHLRDQSPRQQVVSLVLVFLMTTAIGFLLLSPIRIYLYMYPRADWFGL